MRAHMIPTDVTVRRWAILTQASAAASVGAVCGYLYRKRGLEAAMVRAWHSRRRHAPWRAACAKVEGLIVSPDRRS
jgi:hypothetical protein